MSKDLKSPWSIREVITCVLLSVLTIVLMLVDAMITTFGLHLQMIASGAFGAFLAAPAYMLMVSRVNHRGATTVFCAIAVLVFCTMGNFLYLAPFFIAFGLIFDATLLSTDKKRQSFAWPAGAWSAFSGFYLLSTMIPFFTDLEAYLAQVVANRGVGQDYIDTFLHYYTNPLWVAAICAITIAAGFAGSLVGRRLMRRHFERPAAL